MTFDDAALERLRARAELDDLRRRMNAQLRPAVTNRDGRDEPEPTAEFLPVVICDGREWGRREQVDICATREAACALGAQLAANVGMGARYVVLRRAVGSWAQIADSDDDR